MPYEHEGHRQRMLKKLETEDLLEVELLEIMLYPVLPRVNTSDVAHRLLAKYETLERLFAAPIDEIATMKGIGRSTATAISCMGRLSEKYAAQVLPYYMGVFTVEKFLDYGKCVYAKEKREVMDLYFLDERGYIVARRRLATGEDWHVGVDTQTITKLIATTVASGVVFVHNHPKGETTSSFKDDEATRKLQLICSMNGMLLCDHIVFGPNGAYSYYQSGELPRINRNYSVRTTIRDKLRKEIEEGREDER